MKLAKPADCCAGAAHALLIKKSNIMLIISIFKKRGIMPQQYKFQYR